MESFVSIDFETADEGSDSACAMAMVRVEKGRIIDKVFTLIRPPRSSFQFSHIHGITWDDVKEAPTFAEVWPKYLPLLEGASWIAAHYAEFDRGVLSACCQSASIRRPSNPFLCTVALARKVWKIYPTKLPHVCHVLQIPLVHHEALSDAEACATIVIRSMEQGAGLQSLLT